MTILKAAGTLGPKNLSLSFILKKFGRLGLVKRK